MTIQSSPFVTIKQAAAALGIEKEAIERRLENGRLKGKKERILARDVWFIYKSELDALLDKRHERLFGDEDLDTPVKNGEQIDFNPAFMEEIVEMDTFAVANDGEFVEEPTVREQFRLSLRLVSEEFSRCLQASLDHIHELRDQLRETEGKLLLLPDLERRAAEDRQMIDDKDAALTRAHERISTLQSQVEHLSRPWWKKLFG